MKRNRISGFLILNILCMFCAFCLVCGMKLPAQAGKYTYTVRIFAGQQGTIHDNGGNPYAETEEKDGEVLILSGLHYGDQVNFNQNMVTLSNGSKYYIRGIRESGKDNNTVSNMVSFNVTGDQDYVVAYGILGDAVAYTVNYVDSEGNTLMPSETYYGNVGDKAVVAYLYIDGYQPQAYNIGMTLKEDPLENVINFVYTRITNTVITIPGQPAPDLPEGEGGGTTIIDQGIIDQEGTNFDGENPGGGNPGGDNPGGDNPGAGGDNPGGGGLDDIEDGQVPGDDGPDDYMDIGDDDTPAGGGFIQGDGSKENPLRIEIGALKIPLSTNIWIGAVSVIAIIIGLSLLLAEILRRKKKDE